LHEGYLLRFAFCGLLTPKSKVIFRQFVMLFERFGDALYEAPTAV